jgi:hypothetical protein
MIVVDREKKITRKIPFYSVQRDDWGWVRSCAKPLEVRCGKCLFKKQCRVR